MKEINKQSALVVLSGGQDSTTCLGWALNNYENVFAITFDYGQRHDRELESAKGVVDFFSRKTGRVIPWEVLALPKGTLGGSSPLTDHDVPLERYTDHESMEKIIGDRIELTFVPMRNALFLTLAANRAAIWGCGVIVTGVCQGDNANYPDCREQFIWRMETAINEALGHTTRPLERNYTRIKTPLMHLSKAETVKMAEQLPHTYSALSYSHTAYDGSYPPVGTDHASVLRAHGFTNAGVPDPLILRAWHAGLCELPDLPNYKGDLEPIMAALIQDWSL